MKQKTFPPSGQTTDRQMTALLNKTMELSKRFKEGTVSHDFTLEGLQNLLESNYAFQTKFGILKLFGSSIHVNDQKQWETNPSQEERLFANEYVEYADMQPTADECKKLFAITQNGHRAQGVWLAPYRYPEKANLEYILDEVEKQELFPRLMTLGHIDTIIQTYLSGWKPNTVLFEGSDGNYFPLRDNQGKIWLLWLFLHTSGYWYYKFTDSTEFLKEKLREDARLWLISKKDYIVNGHQFKKQK